MTVFVEGLDKTAETLSPALSHKRARKKELAKTGLSVA